MQPVDTKEHDGRTHAAVLEAVNRDGFAEHDPNPVYSAQFQSTSELRVPDARRVDQDSLAAAPQDMPEVADRRAAETELSETDHDDNTEESALPTPIRHNVAASSDEPAAEIAGEGAELFQTFSTPPRNGTHGARAGDSGSAVLPAASSPLFEPQAALLHTVRASQPPPLQHTCVLLMRAAPAWLAQMRAQQGGVLGTEAVAYMQQLLCSPQKQHARPTQSNEKGQNVVGLSPSLSAIKSACAVARTDSGNVDI